MKEKLEIEYVLIDKIRPNEYNPKRMNEKAETELERSITEFGIVDPIIANRAKGREGIIIGGHQRYKIYQKLKYEKVPVIWLDISDLEREKELCLRLSKNTGSWNWDLLADFDKDLLKDVGWDNNDIYKIFDLDEFYKDKNESKKLSEIKILNLYAGIGGNRRLWGDLDITAVELNKEIANAYQKLYPKDKVVIEDAHKYLEENFNKFDFIWSSPPCPTHSRLMRTSRGKPRYPDMKLYEEILFLKQYFKGKWVVENVISWYNPLIEPQKRGRHYYWSNFEIPELDYPWKSAMGPINKWNKVNINIYAKRFCFDEKDLPSIKGYPKATILRNLIYPKEGEFILKSAF